MRARGHQWHARGDADDVVVQHCHMAPVVMQRCQSATKIVDVRVLAEVLGGVHVAI